MPDFFSSINSLGALGLIVLGFGFLIFVHELGHFLVAKWVGIKVTQFALGMGPGVFAWRKGIGFRLGSTEPEYEARIKKGQSPASMGETEYRLNYLPLGGYVKMLGQEDMDPAARSDDPRSFNRKSGWARAAVICAGVVMNLIFGAVFFVVAFRAGVEFAPAMVGSVSPGSPADTTYAQGHEGDPTYRGLQPGDVVTHIDGEAALDFMDLAAGTVLGEADAPVTLRIRRGDQALMYRLQPQRDANTKFRSLGIAPPISVKIGENLRAEELPQEMREAGVKPGMRLVSVAGQEVSTFGQVSALVTAAQGRDVTVEFQGEQGERAALQWRAQPKLVSDAKRSSLLGIAPVTSVERVVPHSAASEAGVRAGDLIARLGEFDWPTPSQVRAAVIAAGDAALPASVLREGELIALDAIRPRNGLIGVGMAEALDQPLASFVEGAPATLAFEQPPAGSRVIAMNGVTVANFADLQRKLAAAATANPEGSSVEMTLEINLPQRYTVTRSVPLTRDDAAALMNAGWTSSNPGYETLFEMLRTPVVADTLSSAAMMGLKKTHQVMVQTYVTVLRLFQRSVPLEAMSGPVGIAHHGTAIAQQGWSYLCFFLGLISINLVVINLLPIPVLDGGLLVFLVIEKIMGSPVSAQVQTVATVVGMCLIGALVLFVTYHDLGRLWQSLAS